MCHNSRWPGQDSNGVQRAVSVDTGGYWRFARLMAAAAVDRQSGGQQ
jgi:hypothetical protein